MGGRAIALPLVFDLLPTSKNLPHGSEHGEAAEMAASSIDEFRVEWIIADWLFAELPNRRWGPSFLLRQRVVSG
jgi:hypothetical protein